VLNVIQQLEKALSSTPPLANVGDLLGAIGKVADCFLMITPCPLIKMIVDIIDMILRYVDCMIQAFDSILQFQAGLDFNAAEGNPVLLLNMQCTQDNMQASMDALNDGMQGIAPLMQTVNMLLDIAGQKPIEMPALSTGSLAGAVGDPLEPVKKIRDSLQQAVDVLKEICP
jgi:hypothetical protein